MKIPVASIEYVGRSFSVIPIKPRGKEPIMAWKEFQTRRADEQEVRSWFDKWPDANVGTITGEISEMVVIDLDSVEAKDRLKEQAGEYDLNCVPRSRTGKGWQLFFKHPGGKIPNRAGILPGLDLRADGGYVVLPPSVHPNGKIYKWEVPQNGEFPKLPAELFKLITSSVKRQESRERFDTAQALAGVPEGQRDDMVFRFGLQATECRRTPRYSRTADPRICRQLSASLPGVYCAGKGSPRLCHLCAETGYPQSE